MSKIDDNDDKENAAKETGVDTESAKEDFKNARDKAKQRTAPARDVAKKVLSNKKVKAAIKKFILANLPIIIIVILIILAIIFLLGIIIYIFTMPGLFLAKLDKLTRETLGNISGVLTGDNVTITISKEQVIDLAQYLQSMGYDVETYGFGEVTYEDDDSDDLNTDENSDDYNQKTTFNQNGKTRQIKKVGASVDDKNYLLAYLVADENTYNLANVSALGIMYASTDAMFNIFSKPWKILTSNGDNVKINKSQIKSASEKEKEISTGMIEIDGYDPYLITQSNDIYAKIDRENGQMKVYTKAFSLTGPSLALSLANVSISPALFTIGSGNSKVQFGDVFTYDLDDWLARYGRPKELLIAVHLATMMPDLAYKIAADGEFNTKVHVDFNTLDVNYNVDATKDDSTLSTEDIEKLFLDNCVGSGEVKVKKIKKNNETSNADSSNPDDYDYIEDTNSKLTESDTYSKILSELDDEQKQVFFDELWKQIESGIKVFSDKQTDVSGFTKLWGVNIISAEAKAHGKTGILETIKGEFSKSLLSSIKRSDTNTYAYLKISDDTIPGTNWTYNEVINLARLTFKGNTGIKNVKWPYIRSVDKHWFYNDIDFEKNTYRVARTATKTMDYKPEDKNNALYKDNIEVKLNATLTSSANGGVIYQVCEPEATGPNDAIKNVFAGKDANYYRYDGSDLTAQRISNSKAIDKGDTSYKFRGQKYSVKKNNDTDTDSSGNGSMIEEKRRVNFNGDSTSALSAFEILENVHTEASDYIYRNLKELMVSLKYFNESEMATDLKSIMLWPIKTDYQYTEWTTTKDDNEFGTKIICNPSETTVICPTDAKVLSVNGNSITLELTKINDDTVKLYNYIYNRNSQYNLSNINADIFDGIQLTITGVSLGSTYASGQTIARGSVIGEAQSDKDGNSTITITMQNLDKSVIDDMDAYFYQTHNTKYEEIMLNQMNNKDNAQAGIDITNFGRGSYILNQLMTGSTIGANNIDGLKVTENTISRDNFISITQSYAKKHGGSGFASSAGTIYDICIENGINPVWAAAQARQEGSWNIVRKKPNNYWSMGAVNSDSNAGDSYGTIEESTQTYCNNLNHRISGKAGALARSKELQPYDNVHFHGAMVGLYDVFSNYAVPDPPTTPERMIEHTVNYVNKIIGITKSIYGEYGINQ